MRSLGRYCFVISAIATAFSQTRRPGTPPSNVGTIYILSTGQSNVTGRNDGDGDANVNSNVQAWNGSSWVTMQEGVIPMGTVIPYQLSPNPNSNNATWAFAKVVQQRTGAQVRVVLLSWGGESITNWLGTTSTNYSFIRNTMTSIGNPPIDYLIWDQGEADGAMGDAIYAKNLQTVIGQFRAEKWFPFNTQIILTGLDTSDPTYAGPHFAQRGLAAGDDSFIHFAETTGLSTVPGGVHWSGPATVTLGSILYVESLSQNPERQQLSTVQRNLIATYAPNAWPAVIVHDTDTNLLYKWIGSWLILTPSPLAGDSTPCILQGLGLGWFACSGRQ
jgi:hypothetical protein